MKVISAPAFAGPPAAEAIVADYTLVLDSGEEVTASLERFCAGRGGLCAHFSGIGALKDAVLAYFDWETKTYQRMPVRGQVEVASLAGTVALLNGKPKVHAHAVLGQRDGSALAGHLLEGIVRPTLELSLRITPYRLVRAEDVETGLTLIRGGEGLTEASQHTA